MLWEESMLLKQREFSWIVLLPLSMFWAMLSLLRRLIFSSAGYQSKFPVIAVGNIHSGGSGKTPLVAAIAAYFEKRNSIIISRGYKRKSKKPVLEVTEKESVLECGDEPFLLRRRTGRPVFVGAKRSAVAKKVEEAHGAGILVMDDGFQHLSLKKDISLVVINAQKDFLDSYCLPLGDLREPVCALKFASAVVLVDSGSKENLLLWKTFIEEHFPELPVFSAIPKVNGLNTGEPVSGMAVAFCGIANPERFAHAIPNGKVVRFYPDHHSYTEKDIDWLIEKKKTVSGDYFLTTEKDYYKVERGFAKKGEKVAFLKQEIELPVSFWAFLEKNLGEAA